jgi:UDP-glucose 4-epimerase
VTGAAGYIGRLVLRRLAEDRGTIEKIVAIDLREAPPEARLCGVEHVTADVRSPELAAIFERHAVDSVVHLASVVAPLQGPSAREIAHSIDVLGTKNVLEACAAARVRHLVVTSSGAAYGFHPDNPEWLRESHPLRGNEEFAYAYHKRLVEELLARWRKDHPEIRQLVLRPGAVIGETTRNQITDLFEKPVILGVRGAASPFAFIWDEDLALCIAMGLHKRREGIFNVAGDGAMTLCEIAARTKKRFLPLPAPLLSGALWALRRAGLTQYGPEQVSFLRWRSALANDALKEEFGFRPRKTAREAFEHYWRARSHA